MDKILNDYLEKVDKYLKPVKVTDRMDIIKEIESDMAELGEHGGLSANEIVDRLGAVSYTHLDVYKRQLSRRPMQNSSRFL